MKTWRILLDGILLCVGMLMCILATLLLSSTFMMAFGGYMDHRSMDVLFYSEWALSSVLTVVLGIILRRVLWERPQVAATIFGIGLLAFSAVVTVLSVLMVGWFYGWEEGVGAALGYNKIYGVKLWLPFAAGLLLGGIRRKRLPPALPEVPL